MSRRVALLVGIKSFQDKGLSRLLAPEEDVINFREALLDPKIGRFEKAEILFDSNLLEVQSALHELTEGKSRDDLILFYYSGHGLLDGRNQLHLALPTSRARAPTIGSLEAAYVRARMNESASRRQIVILDCCHSGAFKIGAKRSQGDPALTEATFDPDGYGRYVLTACSETEFAYEDGILKEGDPTERPRSVFTRCIVEGLTSGQAAPDREVITVDSLYFYTRRRVRQEGAPMDPHRFLDEGVGEMVIAYNPNPKTTEVSQLREEAEHGSKSIRLKAVGQLANLASGGGADADSAKEVLLERLDEEGASDVRKAIQRALGAAEKSGSLNWRTAVSARIEALTTAGLLDEDIAEQAMSAAMSAQGATSDQIQLLDELLQERIDAPRFIHLWTKSETAGWRKSLRALNLTLLVLAVGFLAVILIRGAQQEDVPITRPVATAPPSNLGGIAVIDAMRRVGIVPRRTYYIITRPGDGYPLPGGTDYTLIYEVREAGSEELLARLCRTRQRHHFPGPGEITADVLSHGGRGRFWVLDGTGWNPLWANARHNMAWGGVVQVDLQVVRPQGGNACPPGLSPVDFPTGSVGGGDASTE